MKTRFIKTLAFQLAVVSLLLGCVSPKPLSHKSYVDDDGQTVFCSQNFPEWEIHQEISLNACKGGGDIGLICVVFWGTSAIVSGSVYAVGNVLHWAERDGECTAKATLVSVEKTDTGAVIPSSGSAE
ncbi:MAG: hypothetical protein CMI09_15945 [Oceanospirillaceae bacterium]|nr:hypothetical protein [Oceanospirillaceae bacterium]